MKLIDRNNFILLLNEYIIYKNKYKNSIALSGFSDMMID